MDSQQIIRELDRIATTTGQIENAAGGLSRVMQTAIDYLDSLEDALERETVGEVLEGIYVEPDDPEATPYTEFMVADPPIKPGSETVYLDGSPVDSANYAVLKASITTELTIPDGAVVSIDYTHRGERADVVDAFTAFEDLSLAELLAARTDYQTAVQWIEQNLLT